MANNKLKYILTMDSSEFKKAAKSAGVNVKGINTALAKTEKTGKKTFGSLVSEITTFSVGTNQGLELLKKLYSIMKTVSATFVEFDSSVTLIEKRLGTTREEAGELNIEMQALSETFGTSFSGELKAANALMKEFGVTSKVAIGLIGEAAEKIPDQFDELLNQVTEYSSQLNQIGIEADQFLAISIQALQQGVFSDKGVDAIKEFNLRLREMTPAASDALKAIGLVGTDITMSIESGEKTVFDVLEEVSAKIREQGINSKVTGQVFADLFGGAGEDAGKFILQIDKLNKSLGTTETQISNAQLQQLKLNQELEKTTQELTKKLLPLYTKLAKASTVTAVKTLGYFEDLTDWYNTSPVVDWLANFNKNFLIDPLVNIELEKTFSTIAEANKALGITADTGEEASSSLLDIFGGLRTLSDFINLANASATNTIAFIPDPDETEEILETVTKEIADAFDKIDKSYKEMLESMADAPEFVGVGSESWLEKQEMARSRVDEIGASDAEIFAMRQKEKLNFLKESLDLQYISEEEFAEKKRILADETATYERYAMLDVITSTLNGLAELGKQYGATAIIAKRLAQAAALITTYEMANNAFNQAVDGIPAPFGLIAAPIAAAAAIAAGLANVAKIESTTFADGGGMTTGPSHAQGGTKFITKNQPDILKEYEGGEYILSGKTTARIGKEELDRWNFGGGSPRHNNGKFQAGGSTTISAQSATAQSSTYTTVVQLDSEVIATATNLINNNNSGSGAILTENT